MDLQDYLPEDVAWSAGRIEDKQGRLWDVEETTISKSIARRRKEFRAGRTCAREALALLGHPPIAIPVGKNRAPCWPSGVVGSISHTEMLALAVAARSDRYAGLGIDLESDVSLKPDLHRIVLRSDELRCLPPRLQLGGHTVDAGKAVFAIKEAIFKAVYPLIGAIFHFQDAHVLVEANSERYSARLELPSDTMCPLAGRSVCGVIRHVTGHVLATAIIHADQD